jgi:hypothetical protein
VNCYSQDYIIPQLRKLRQTAWQAKNKLTVMETRAKKLATNKEKTAAAAARISKTSYKKASASY